MTNAPALWSVVVGLLAATAVPLAALVADRRDDVDLLWAAIGVPVAIVLGLTAIALARRGRRRAELSLRRQSGSLAARLGSLLGTLGLLLAGSGITALLVYALLTYRGSS